MRLRSSLSAFDLSSRTRLPSMLGVHGTRMDVAFAADRLDVRAKVPRATPPNSLRSQSP